MSNSLGYDHLKNVPRRSYDPARLLRDLESQFKLSRDPIERARLADWIVPEYVSYGNPEAAAGILAEISGGIDADSNARISALRAEVSAMQGRNPQPYIDAAVELLPQLVESGIALVRHRLGVAYFFARKASEAEEQSLYALSISDIGGLRRLASRTASVLYAIHYNLTGDLEAARYYAELATVEATAAGDDKFRRSYLIAQLNLAVMFGEWDRSRSLIELLRRERWYDAYMPAVGVREATILVQAHAGDFAAMRGTIDAMLESASTNPDYVIARALKAVALAGLGLDDEALREARRALGLSKAHDKSEMAYLTIRRRAGAVIAAYICVLLGDVHRGARALASRRKWPGSIGALARALEGVLQGVAIDANDPNLRSIKGYAELANLVRLARTQRLESTPLHIRTLTDTELTLLRASASGKTNGEIARERGVTRNAVERRLMSAYEKLGVRTRTEAIAKLAKI